MANIATLLARILTTRYGRDMRQDLHDSIEAVNNDTENALGKKLTFTNNTRKLKLLAKDDTVLSEVVIPGGGSGGGSVDSVNGLFPDENGNVEVNLDDINDVDITSVSNGDALVYDATSHKWVNGTGGGGTSDYSQLTNKPSINGVTLSGNKTSADLGLQSELTFTSTPSANNKVVCQNDLPSGGGSNRNLLDNPWFSINQRSDTVQSNLLFDGQYHIDRWQTNNNLNQRWNWNKNSIYMDCTYGTGFGQIVQQFERFPLKEGQKFTLSVLYGGGVIKSTTATYSESISEYYTPTYSDSFAGLYCVPSSNYYTVYFRCNEGGRVSLLALKLEIGTESTLALDVAPNYTEELLKCQRYYYRITAQSNYSNIAMGMGMPSLFHVDSVLKLPTHMRTTPILNVAGTLDAYTSGSNITSTSISVHSWCGDIIALNLGFSSSDTIQSAPYILRLGNQGDYIEFKAEL